MRSGIGLFGVLLILLLFVFVVLFIDLSEKTSTLVVGDESDNETQL